MEAWRKQATPVGGLALARGGPWRHSHAQRRLPVARSGGGGAPTTDGQGEHEHEMQEVKAKLLVVLTRSGEAWSSGNVVTAELGGGVHGKRSHGESRGSEGEWEGQEMNEGGVLSERRGRRASPNARGSGRDAWRGGGTRGNNGRRALLHG